MSLYWLINVQPKAQKAEIFTDISVMNYFCLNKEAPFRCSNGTALQFLPYVISVQVTTNTLSHFFRSANFVFEMSAPVLHEFVLLNTKVKINIDINVNMSPSLAATCALAAYTRSLGRGA